MGHISVPEALLVVTELRQLNGRSMKTLPITVLAAALAFSSSAWATTINITDFSDSAFNNATSNLGNVVTEDFEDLGGEGEVTPGTSLSTDVGSFTTVGGTGSGGTVSGLAGNTGTNVAIRDGNVFGRTNTTPGGSFFLDSNDTFGISWDVTSSLGLFDTIIFSLMDASEFSFLRVTVDGVSQEQRLGSALGNGNTSLVEIVLGSSVSSLTLELANFTAFGGSSSAKNDGFSIDGIAVGLAPVPGPASLPLFAAGAGAFAFMRRKQRKS